jgi:uncharacterized membrane protein
MQIPDESSGKADTHKAENEEADEDFQQMFTGETPYNPLLCDTIEHNIRTLSALRHRERRKRNVQDRTADLITDFSGSMIFVYLHAVLFAIWIVMNVGGAHNVFGFKPFDPYPFQLLTLIVSLEAIFLSTFVLISQNRMGAQADKRAELDLHVGLLSEHEITRMLKMLDAIQDKLGIENDEDSELAELESDLKPQDVLKEIERIETSLNKVKRRARSQGILPNQTAE